VACDADLLEDTVDLVKGYQRLNKSTSRRGPNQVGLMLGFLKKNKLGGLMMGLQVLQYQNPV